jgi:hypothetical protein
MGHPIGDEAGIQSLSDPTAKLKIPAATYLAFTGRVTAEGRRMSSFRHHRSARTIEIGDASAARFL